MAEELQHQGQLYITISAEPLTKPTPEPTPTPEEPEPKPKEPKDKLSPYIAHELMHFARSQATQMINYSIGNIGNFTGDYNAQREATNAYQVFNQMKGLGLAAYGGFIATGTAAGGVVGLGVAVASMAINTALQTHAAQMQLARTNYSIEQLRDLSGLNPRTNGNR